MKREDIKYYILLGAIHFFWSFSACKHRIPQMLSLSFSASSRSRRRTCIIKALFTSAAAKDVVSAINDVETLQSQQQPTTRRRTRRRTLASSDIDSNEIPSLADFMHRAKVLKQYRNFIRLAQYVDDKDTNANAPSGKGGECRAALEEVRLSYKLGMKKSVDALAKNMTYSEVSFCNHRTIHHSFSCTNFHLINSEGGAQTT